MDPDLFAQGMVIQVSWVATGIKGTDEVAGIDTEGIDFWDSPGYRSPDILVSVAHDIVEVATNTGGTIVGCDALANFSGCNRFELFGTIGGKDGNTIFAEHPDVSIQTTNRNAAQSNFVVTGSYKIALKRGSRKNQRDISQAAVIFCR